MAGIIRELLNKEHSAKNRKQILEFLNDRMRIIPFTLLKDEEVLKTLENIFKEEVFSYFNIKPLIPEYIIMNSLPKCASSCSPLSWCRDKCVKNTVTQPFQFARANLSYVDNLFMYLGNSILMDKYERQQSIAKYFVGMHISLHYSQKSLISWLYAYLGRRSNRCLTGFPPRLLDLLIFPWDHRLIHL